MRIACAAALALAVSSPVRGEQIRLNPEAHAKLGALRGSAQANPYGRLFRDVTKPAPVAQDRKPAPKVVCGMLMIPSDPSLDQKMRITPPQDSNVEHTIRAIEPTICKP